MRINIYLKISGTPTSLPHCADHHEDLWIYLVNPFISFHHFRILTLPFIHSFQHLYLALQTVAFVVMSIMIMRLKLFGTPALCLMASLLASRQVRCSDTSDFGHIRFRSLIFRTLQISDTGYFGHFKLRTLQISNTADFEHFSWILIPSKGQTSVFPVHRSTPGCRILLQDQFVWHPWPRIRAPGSRKPGRLSPLRSKGPEGPEIIDGL